MKKINTDLSKLTNLPEDLIDKLLSLIKYCISENVYEDFIENKTMSSLDLGFGQLIIKLDFGQLKIKFIPSEDLNMDLKNVLNGGKSSFHKKLEKTLSAKLIDIYKDIV